MKIELSETGAGGVPCQSSQIVATWVPTITKGLGLSFTHPETGSYYDYYFFNPHRSYGFTTNLIHKT